MECIFAIVMNTALLSIGTNENREENLSLCHRLLEKEFDYLYYSDTTLSSPYGSHYKEDFLNQLAIVQTEKEKDEVAAMLKNIERKIGRKSSDKKGGLVKIDIDLVIWNEELLKPVDMNRNYIKDLLPSLPDGLLP